MADSEDFSNSHNPVLRRMARDGRLTNSHKRAKKQETLWAKRVGGAKIVMSGAGDIKGDVRVKGVLRIENKTTKHASFSVTLDMVRKIEAAALGAAETPAIVVEFNDGNGRVLGEVAIVPTYVLDELCRK